MQAGGQLTPNFHEMGVGDNVGMGGSLNIYITIVVISRAMMMFAGLS